MAVGIAGLARSLWLADRLVLKSRWIGADGGWTSRVKVGLVLSLSLSLGLMAGFGLGGG